MLCGTYKIMLCEALAIKADMTIYQLQDMTCVGLCTLYWHLWWLGLCRAGVEGQSSH